ncbi:ABC transporter ATP-binding protein [Methanocella sp. MCL-LM]|uniref:ABC transporter ATP-binding protein n=1 Tax=Methanocella sp. MCL-LM TaxID=3412035 RepID=UPI003C759844
MMKADVIVQMGKELASMRKTIPGALRLVWESAPGWTVANFGITFVQGLLPLASIYLMKLIVDSFLPGLYGTGSAAPYSYVLLLIVAAGAIALLTVACRLLLEMSSEAQSMIMTDKVTEKLHSQSVALDLRFYEDSEYHNMLHRALREAPMRPTQIMNDLVQLSQSLISIVAIAAVLFTFNWVIGLLLFAAASPAAIVRLIYSRKKYGFEREKTENERQAWYYHMTLTEPEYAKEVRLYNLGPLFIGRYRKIRADLFRGRLALTRMRISGEMLTQAFTTIAIFGAFAFIAHQTYLGRSTVGDLVMYFTGFQMCMGFLNTILRSMTGLYESNLFLNDYLRFEKLKPSIVAPEKPVALPSTISRGIEFKSVSFAYPGSSKNSLDNVDLSIKPGQVIAIVGENGSGKTTLIKLLCRLYDPVAGKITVDGIDLTQTDPAKWRNKITVVFQDYMCYYMRVWENIWIGNVNRAPDRDEVAKAAHMSGADKVIGRLPEGYDSLLGRMFGDGSDLSGGEWQKVALARAFFRDADIMVLDEPTSSLDPVAEAEVFDQFRNLIRGKMAILISHRFSTVQMADYIYVMKNGKIVERGTHRELIDQNGVYARLYTVQATPYRDAAGVPQAGAGVEKRVTGKV